jgi:hypothetical protein
MNIFQKSVLQKHLNNLDKDAVKMAFERFRSNYSPEKIEKIKTLKEEEYQDGFLRDLFVNVLGYTLKPDDNFNLVRELKNQSDSKKADGAIVVNDKVVAVIELKSTSTKDLSGVAQQAFNYKNNQPDCKYVITSNFQKLRFYIENSADYEPFDLFELSPEEFAKLYLLLSKDSILNNLPEKIKQESIFHEEQVTKKLYADYQAFKDRIFDNLVKGNPQYDKLTLFKKAQKLLDRILFILFAEDKGLIPPNTIKHIISDWEAVCQRNRYEPLYNFFKDYFGYIDKGFVVPDFGEIPAYNGGLFSKDEILDHPDLNLPDGLLRNYTPVLSKYDFNSEIDVNILGHIFEHSLSEIEELTAAIQGQPIDNTKTKRKKDGIFYTPKYITKYIVENTVGALCTEQKEKLKINELLIDDTYHNENGTLNHKADELVETLRRYKNWLLTLKILDPACGSGAFLNQALDFLIAEHLYIDELIESVSGVKAESGNNDKAILENNIYGVDINEESVEIAKLSLWLRTAQRGRPLSDLSGNIKCGNSLIDDPEVAGEKAFDWEKEFPHIFNPAVKEKVYQKLPESTPDYVKLVKEKSKEAQLKAEQAAILSKEALEISKQVYKYAEKISEVKEPDISYGINKGGFDVVLGNPPYGVNFNKTEKNYLAHFDNLVPDYEIYIYFISLATDKLLKPNGKLGYIFPNTFLSILYGKKYREKLINNFTINEIVDLSEDNTFVDASVRTCILNLTNFKINEYKVEFKKITDNITKTVETINLYSKSVLVENLDNWLSISSVNSDSQSLINKVKKNQVVNDSFEVSQGLIPYDKYRGHSEFQIKNRVWHADSKKNETYRKELKGGDVNRYNIFWNGSLWISYGDWLAAPRKEYFFKNPRILVREITATSLYCCYTEEEYYNTPSLINIIDSKKNLGLKYLLTILNSKLIGWYHNNVSPKAKKGLFPKILINDVRNIPIKSVSKQAQQPFIEKAELMLTLNKALQIEKQNFINSLKEDKGVVKITRAIECFNELEYDAFKKELLKQKVKISLGNENNQWREYFNTTKQKANELQNQINQTDREIDRMVYELYELTEEEIEIVENAAN